jgi:hypothetical protein
MPLSQYARYLEPRAIMSAARGKEKARTPHLESDGELPIDTRRPSHDLYITEPYPEGFSSKADFRTKPTMQFDVEITQSRSALGRMTSGKAFIFAKNRDTQFWLRIASMETVSDSQERSPV